MIRRQNILTTRLAATATATTLMFTSSTSSFDLSLYTTKRFFNSTTTTVDELGPMHKMKQITPIVGQPKPCAREEEWVLRFNLRDRMEDVIRVLLREQNWAEAEIDREVKNFMGGKYGNVKQQHDRRSNWETVEEFQRTPWYRRWRPNESSSMPMVSFDLMKILETNLIPPSARHDPYAHLRKRHYEDTFHNEKFSEGNVKELSRERLGAYTKGMPQYGKYSRKEFLAFEKEYRKRQPGVSVSQSETYNAWRASQK